MPHDVRINLDEHMFGEAERCLAASGKLSAFAFRYPSGVAAIRIENGAGSAVLLPFQGQQIWDASFFGRSLTMRSMFDQPLPTRDYLGTYGAFFIHCGGTSMGNPGPEDTHPLHGELPNLPYDSATLAFGEDAEGAYVELGGQGRDRRAFDHDFAARPSIRLHEDATSFGVTMSVENLARKPMPWLYLAHINFLPADGGTLIDTVRDDRRDIVVRSAMLPEDAPAPVRAYHAAVAVDPAAHRQIAAGVPIEPELVLTMKAPAGGDGWTHAIQRRPDGSGDFVSYRPAELPYAVRWITRSGDQDALGLVLPATAPPDGLAAARRNGHLIWIEPGGQVTTSFRFGVLSPTAREQLEMTIAEIRNQ